MIRKLYQFIISNKLKNSFPPKNINHTFGLVEKISSIKEKEEIDSIKKAILISQNVFDDILKIIKPGITELDISAEISYRHKKYGASRDAFGTNCCKRNKWREATCNCNLEKNKKWRNDNFGFRLFLQWLL